MKKLFFLMLTAICVLSCEQSPVQPDPVQPGEQEDSQIQTLNNSLRGVWLLDYDNDKGLFFISFKPTSQDEGTYAMCVSETIMSSGTYKISSSKNLQLTNYMGYNWVIKS